jgi:hypothetical protein
MKATPYQYVKLGSNLEFLRGVATVSVMQTTSLAACPKLLENLSNRRYSVANVASAVRSLLVQLEELGLGESLRVAEAFRPMLKQMEGYIAGLPPSRHAFLNDPFAERLVNLAVTIGTAVRTELADRVDAVK